MGRRVQRCKLLLPLEVADLACPACHGALTWNERQLRCQTCQTMYPVVDGIPSLLPGKQEDWSLMIAHLDRESRRHPWVVAKMSLASGSWLPSIRRQLLESIPIRAGNVVLDHCTGRGDNLPALQRAVGAAGRVFGFDLSSYGLRRAGHRLARLGVTSVQLQQADAHALPYPAARFDVVVHFGAWNQLHAPERALEEIVRVTRPGGWVVVLDEGLDPTRRDSWWGRVLKWGNPLFDSTPPLELFRRYGEPAVRWVVRGMFYEVRFTVPCR